jgi:di/tricarboxylate transporter
MTPDQALVFCTLFLAFILYIWGPWRYDLVSLLALLALTITGVVPWDHAFTGFGHPAVVTVAAVLITSRGLHNSGIVEMLAEWLSRAGNSPTIQVASLTGSATIISGFMNNVGALALLMPVGIRMALMSGISPSILLMPLAFGGHLGGLLTLVGTPSNIVISTFRAENIGEPFRMLDFTPVGAGVALAGFIFISLIGWRLTPQRKAPSSKEDLFDVEDYFTELKVPEGSKMAGKTLNELESATKAVFQIEGIVSGDVFLRYPSILRPLLPGDILIVMADADDLKTLLDDTGFELAEGVKDKTLKSSEIGMAEAVVMANSPLVGLSARSLNLRLRYGVNLLAVSRQGARIQKRLSQVGFRPGDVILLHGPSERMPDIIAELGCLPLAERGLKLGHPRRSIMALGIFGSAVLIAAAGLLPAQIAFVSAAAAMVMVGLLSLHEAYESVDWPVIILLGAMMPVSQALESTGGANLVASFILQISNQYTSTMALAIVLVGTALLSEIVNNAAAALLMAPVSISVAQELGASFDPFLMAVVVGASASFLTPIGHQSNVIVMGPGGYRFGDYWRMGLPLEAIMIAVSLPLILWFWPLFSPSSP